MTVSKEKQLRQKIDALLAKVSKTQHAAAIARYRYRMAKRQLTTESVRAETLQEELDGINKQGRDAVFELMVSISHRRFMRFLKEKGHC
jgi:DNA gyrase/topoisomerase IV subunit A